MISVALASLALAAAPPPDTGAQRKAYASCLSGVLRSSTGEKLTMDDFEKALRSKCAAQESSFRTALVNADMKMGTKKAAAEENAEFDITGYIDNMKASYEGHASKPQ